MEKDVLPIAYQFYQPGLVLEEMKHQTTFVFQSTEMGIMSVPSNVTTIILLMGMDAPLLV